MDLNLCGMIDEEKSIHDKFFFFFSGHLVFTIDGLAGTMNKGWDLRDF